MTTAPQAAPPEETTPAVTGSLRDVPAYVWLFLGGLLWNIFSGTSGALLGLPLSPDRPLFLLALVLLLLDPRPDRLRPRANQALVVLLLAWVFWSWISTGSLFDTYKAFAFTDRLALPVVMFLVGPLIFSDTRSRDLLLKTLALLGVYLGVTGILETTGPPALVFPRGVVQFTLDEGGDRAHGVFLSAESLGMSVTIIAVTSAVLVTRTRGRWRAVAALSALTCAVTAVLSLTRSVWIGEALVLVLCVLAVPSLRRRLPVLIAAGIVAVLLFAALAPAMVEKLTNRADTSRSVYDRLLTNDAALRILDYHPIHGVGWGRFIDVTDVWVRQADTYPITTTKIIVHNVFLSLAADTGIPGAVLWGLVMLTGPVAVVLARHHRSLEMQAWRLIAASAILVWIVPTMTSPNPYPFPNNLVWLVGGVAGHAVLVRRRAGAHVAPDEGAEPTSGPPSGLMPGPTSGPASAPAAGEVAQRRDRL